MKKSLYVLLAVLMTGLSMQSFGWYERTTVNGGPNGFLITNKSVDDDGNTSIRCEEPGNTACPTTIAPEEDPSKDGVDWVKIDELVTYSLVKISNNFLSGSHHIIVVVGSETRKYTVTWNSLDIDALNSTIEIDKEIL